MSAGAIEAGQAYVELRARDLTGKGITEAEKRLAMFGQNLAKIGAAATAAGVATITAFVPAIQKASEYQQLINRVGVAFKDQSQETMEWANVQSKAMQRSSADLLDYASSVQSIFSAMGFATDKASDLSRQLAELAVDLGSYWDVEDSEAMRSLVSAMTGEYEPMKKFGVVLSDAQVKDRGAALGFDPKTMDDVQKVMARFAIIMERTSDVQGDAARTSGDFSNKLKGLKANFDDMLIAIGQAVLPMVSDFIDMVKSGAESVKAWADEHPELFERIVKTTLALGGLATGLGTAMMAIGATTMALISIKAAAMGASVSLATLATSAAGIGSALAIGWVLYNLYDAITATIDTAATGFDNFNKQLEQNAKAMKAVATLDKLAATTKLSGDEAKSAEDAIAALAEQYGDLGVKVDEATGKLEGWTEAQRRAVNAQIRADNIKALTADYEAAKAAYAQATNEMFDATEQRKKWTGGLVGAQGIEGSEFENLTAVQADFRRNVQRIKDELDAAIAADEAEAPKDQAFEERAGRLRVLQEQMAEASAARVEAAKEASEALKAVDEREHQDMLARASDAVRAYHDKLRERAEGVAHYERLIEAQRRAHNAQGVESAEKRLAEYRLRMEKEIAQVREGRIDSALERLKEPFAALGGIGADLMGRIRGGIEAAAEQRTPIEYSSRGIFQANQVQSLQGGDSDMKQIKQDTARLVGLVRDLYDKAGYVIPI